MLEEHLNDLKEQLLAEADLVEKMLLNSIKGLFQKKHEMLEEIIRQDEPIVNSMDISIEKRCTQLIALYQPEARNLRLLLMLLKVNYDLERIADHAVNIAQSALDILEYDIEPVKKLLEQTANEAISMFKDSLAAFIESRDDLASKVFYRDDQVDRLRDECINQFSLLIMQRPESSVLFAHLLRIVRGLERIADLSTNIAEYAIFVIKGAIVKHGRDESL